MRRRALPAPGSRQSASAPGFACPSLCRPPPSRRAQRRPGSARCPLGEERRCTRWKTWTFCASCLMGRGTGGARGSGGGDRGAGAGARTGCQMASELHKAAAHCQSTSAGRRCATRAADRHVPKDRPPFSFSPPRTTFSNASPPLAAMAFPCAFDAWPLPPRMYRGAGTRWLGLPACGGRGQHRGRGKALAGDQR